MWNKQGNADNRVGGGAEAAAATAGGGSTEG